MNRCFTIALICIALLAPAKSQALDTVPPNEQEIAHIVLSGLSVVHEDFLYLVSREQWDTREQAALDYLARFDAETMVTTEGISSGMLDRIERHIAWQVGEYELRQSLRPTNRELMTIVEQNRDQFRRPRWIRGSRILIEPSPDQQAAVEGIIARLEAGDESFVEIAREYYLSTGQDHDGRIGQRHEGEINHALFDLFDAQEPGERFFGPVETANGILIGQLEEKGGSYFQSLGELRPRIEGNTVRTRFNTEKEQLIEWAKEEHGLEFLLEASPEQRPAPDKIAYRIDGREITVAELAQLTPGVVARANDPAVPAALAQRSAWIDTITLARGERFPADNDLETRLRNALLHAAHALNHRERAWAEADKSDNALGQFMAEHPHLFTPPARLRVAAVAVPINPRDESIPQRARQIQRDAWAGFTQLADNLPDPTDTAESWPPVEPAPPQGTIIITPEKWSDLATLHFSLARHLAPAETPSRQERLVTPRYYIAWQIFEREEQPVPPLDDVRNEAAGYHELATRAELLAQAWEAPPRPSEPGLE